jgi:hypothetical protein
VDSLIYAQVCTRPNIAYVVGILGRYLSDPGLIHWTAAKKVLRYLKGTKNFILTYRRSDILDVLGYCDADLQVVQMIVDPILDIFYDGRRSCFVEKCQIDAYNFLNYGDRVYSLLPSFMSGYIAAKFYLKASYLGYHCGAAEDIL